MTEGTQSSLSDLLLFELDQEPGVPLDDVGEVSNHVAALDHGLHLMEEGLPLSLRLLREIHGVRLGTCWLLLTAREKLQEKAGRARHLNKALEVNKPLATGCIT